MKNKIFSFKLYIEGLKQTKIIGIVISAMLTVQVFLAPLGRLMINMYTYYEPETESIGFGDINPMLYLMIYIGTPLFVFYLFRFLNNRKASDFYHSIPCSRICLFISYFVAICTWVIFICISTTLIALLANVIIPQNITFNYNDIWGTLLNILTSCLYSGSVVALAMSLTGRVFSNIVLSWVFLQLPNTIISLFNSFVAGELAIIPYGSTSIDILPIAFNSSSSIGFDNIGANVITIIYTVVVFALALIAFKLRKSENAGNPAVNKYLNAGIRVSLCMLFCIFACKLIFSYFVNNEYFTYVELFFAIVIYIIALIAYFLYEIITTRKFRTIPRTLPTLVIVVILNIAFLFSMEMAYNSYLSFAPEEDEIEYIQLYSDYYDIYDLESFLELKSDNIKLYDDEVKKIISDSLKEEIEYIKNREYHYAENYIDVVICADGKEYIRCIELDDAEYRVITKAFDESENNVEFSLPVAGSAYIESSEGNAPSISGRDALNIYNIMREEVSEYSYNEWLNITEPKNRLSYNLCDIYITVQYEGNFYSFDVPLSSKFTKSANEYIKLAYSEESANEILKRLNNDPEELEEITIGFFNTNKFGKLTYYAYDGSGTITKRMRDTFEYFEPVDSINSDDIYAIIYIYDEITYEDIEDIRTFDIDDRGYTGIFKYTGPT